MARVVTLSAALAGALIGAVACATVPLARADDPDDESAPVLVHFPRGDCQTDWIEVELWQRDLEGGGWRPHPQHPRVRAETCHYEQPGGLLNEIRVRCFDPSGSLKPSIWVIGTQLLPKGADPCPQTAGTPRESGVRP